MESKLFLIVLLFSFYATCLFGLVENTKSVVDKKEPKSSAKSKPITDKPIITNHVINLHGISIEYTATAGYINLKTEKQKIKARIFYVAYNKKNVSPDKRSLTFAFNGGPGSSSVWLHLGALGPKKVDFNDFGSPKKPPYKLIDNAYSWLDLTDIVFIDPVYTGFSRPTDITKKKQFFGLKEDISAVGDFIRLYTTINKRWLSPKFLVGESYGTTRAAGLSYFLQKKYGMELNGVILISSVLNFQTISLTIGNDLPYVLFLPTFAATASYHDKIKIIGNISNFIQKVKNWALSEYYLALSKGNNISNSEKLKIASKLSEFTGLSKKYILNSNLRINIFKFTKELLRDQNRTIGRFDSRIKGIDSDSSGAFSEFDPSYTSLLGTFSAGINHYIRNDLNFKTDVPYLILSNKVYPWNWGSASNGFVNVADNLRKAMVNNKFLKVFIACGYYDMATPFSGIEYTVNHMNLEKSFLNNIEFHYYKAGHMMYIHKLSLKQLKNDINNFYKNAVSVK